MTILKNLWKDDAGQDMVEYTLLLGFVALIAAGIMITVSPSVSTVWTITNTDLSKAAASAS
jgi:Flp pilus assembly pilin Flp